MPVPELPPAEVESCVPQGTVLQLFDDYHDFMGSACVVGHSDTRTFMITAFHVISTKPNGGRATESNFGELKTEATDPKLDLALVSVPHVMGTAFELNTTIDFGTPISARGYLAGAPTMTFGHVANPHLGWLDCAVGFGMSGGAVIDADGRLVGLIKRTFQPVDIGIMVLATDIQAMIDEVIQ